MNVKKPKMEQLQIFDKNRSDDLNLAIFCRFVNDIYPDLIEDQKVLRSVIDTQYKLTFKFFTIQFIAYICTYFIPMLINFAGNSESTVLSAICFFS